MGRGVPDRWLDYKAVGNVMADCRIVAFKVPLKQALCDNLKVGEQFSSTNLIDILKERKISLGLVIDLTNTNRYYHPEEFERHGITHLKLRTEGHAVPSSDICTEFSRAMEDFFSKADNAEKVVGVHCTHGVNRTGYLVCRYLIQSKGMEPQQAIKVFNEARCHQMERKNYLEHLHQLPGLLGTNLEAVDACARQLDQSSGVQHYQSPKRFTAGKNKQRENWSRNPTAQAGRRDVLHQSRPYWSDTPGSSKQLFDPPKTFDLGAQQFNPTDYAFGPHGPAQWPAEHWDNVSVNQERWVCGPVRHSEKHGQEIHAGGPPQPFEYADGPPEHWEYSGRRPKTSGYARSRHPSRPFRHTRPSRFPHPPVSPGAPRPRYFSGHRRWNQDFPNYSESSMDNWSLHRNPHS